MSTDAKRAVARNMGWAIAIAMGAIEGYKAVLPEAKAATPASVVERRELVEAINALNLRLDSFNARLSWLEGATSGALKGPPPQEHR